MAKRVKIGDVLQILTSGGVAYAQVLHKHSEYGYLLCIYSGFHEEQVSNYEKVVKSECQFLAFFPVQAAVNQNLVSIVANVDVPENLKVFPVFRARSGGAGGAVWLWNGTESNKLQRELTMRRERGQIYFRCSNFLV